MVENTPATKFKGLLLPNIKNESFKSLNKKLSKSPVFPIVLAALISGVGAPLKLAYSVIAVCAIWLCLDLRSYAEWVSISWTNRFGSSYAGAKQPAQVARRKRQRKIRETIFAMFIITVALGSLFLCARLRKVTFDKQFSETYLKIEAKAAPTPDKDDLFEIGAALTFTNSSASDVLLTGINCYVNAFRSTAKNRMSDVHLAFSGHDVKLQAGGDGDTEYCPMKNVFGFPQGVVVNCSDITWEASVQMSDNPELKKVKKFRFLKSVAGGEWRQVAIGDPLHC